MIKMMHPSNVMTDHKKGFAIGGRKTWSFPSYRLQLFQHWGWYQQGHQSLTRYRYLTLMTLLMVSFVNIQVRGWSSQAWCLSGKFPPGEKWTFMVSSHRKPSETTFSGFSLSPKQRRARSQGVISYLKCLLIPVEAFCLIVLTIPTRSTGWSLSSLDNIKIRSEKKRRVCLFSFAQNFSKITRILVIKTKRHRKSLAPCIRYRLGWIFKRRIRFIGKICRRTPFSTLCLVSSSWPQILC